MTHPSEEEIIAYEKAQKNGSVSNYRNPIKIPLVKLRLAICRWIYSLLYDNHTHTKENERRLKRMNKGK